ncbi:MAG: hypothetical protein ACFE96_08090 [Candidatus Hermodarchaeota archaeon]
MVQNLEIFIGIAHIAGIFVGFEALISATHRKEVGRIRGIVTVGLTTIIASLIPIGLGIYGISGHSLWFLSSLIYFCLDWTVIILSLRMPENREILMSQMKTSPVMGILFWLVFEVPLQVPLILTIIGLFPDLEEAFYITALLFNLFSAAYVLSQIVYTKAN